MRGRRDADPLRDIRHVVLLGLMGSGKTEVGRLLAARLGRPLHDSDPEIEAATGRTVRQIRDRDGPEALHDLEAELLLATLALDGPDVVCAASSVADRPDCVAALVAPGIAGVWLSVPPEVAARRFASSPHRPRYGDDIEAFLERQLATRGPMMAAAARIVVDAGSATPREIADRIVEALAAPPPV
jgi:shikimate kinase